MDGTVVVRGARLACGTMLEVGCEHNVCAQYVALNLIGRVQHMQYTF